MILGVYRQAHLEENTSDGPVATHHDPDASAYYQRKRTEGKKHNAAVICVARRRCDLILAMLKNQERYGQPQPENLPQAA